MAQSLSYKRILYRMGYFEYQRGLIFHHLREHGGWNGHLKKCRDFILKAVEHYRPSVVTALGSGWLLDFPLKEVAETVSRLNLVDIVHPPEVKKQVSGMKNVVLHEEDITGGLITEVWRKAGSRWFFNRLRSMDGIDVPEYQPQYEPGLTVSLNIMTQLETLPLALLKKKAAVDEADYNDFRKKIQQSHLGFLERNKSVLITDLEEVVKESSGKVTKVRSVLVDLPAGSAREEWTWDFDLRKSDFFRRKSVFRVAAILL
jgi:hypothetical protein